MYIGWVSKSHSNTYPHLLLSGVLRIFFNKTLSILFVTSISRRSLVGKSCDILQPYSLITSSYTDFLSRFTWWLPIQNESLLRMLFPSIFLNLSSVLYSSSSRVCFKTAFYMKHGVLCKNLDYWHMQIYMYLYNFGKSLVITLHPFLNTTLLIFL